MIPFTVYHIDDYNDKLLIKRSVIEQIREMQLEGTRAHKCLILIFSAFTLNERLTVSQDTWAKIYSRIEEEMNEC